MIFIHPKKRITWDASVHIHFVIRYWEISKL